MRTSNWPWLGRAYPSDYITFRLLLAFVLAAASSVATQTLTTLYSFCSQRIARTVAEQPLGWFRAATATSMGRQLLAGAHNVGTVFKVNRR